MSVADTQRVMVGMHELSILDYATPEGTRHFVACEKCDTESYDYVQAPSPQEAIDWHEAGVHVVHCTYCDERIDKRVALTGEDQYSYGPTDYFCSDSCMSNEGEARDSSLEGE